MSPKDRAAQIFSYIGSLAGDLPPSVILRTLQYLSSTPKTNSREAGKVNLLMEITLQCFPSSVRDRLPDYRDMETKDFLLKADDVARTHRSEKQTVASAQKEDTSDSETEAEQLAAYLSSKRHRQQKQFLQQQPNGHSTHSQKDEHRYGPKAHQHQTKP